jgi:cytochrome c oxidase subunit IV
MNAPVPSARRFVFALAALLVLLVASVIVAETHLGPWNPVVSLAIAAAKASVVIAIFMRPGEAGPSARFALTFGFAWVGVLIVLTLGDFLTRH